MTQTHWKKLHNPDYLGAYALEPGQDLIATIKVVKNEMVVGADGKKEECTVIYFTENIKPMILNATNAKVITKLHKTPYIEEWAGKRIQIYADKIKAFGELVEALRIRPFEPKGQVNAPAQAPAPAPAPVKCADCDLDITAAGGMTAEKVVEYTKGKYGVSVCAGCGTKRKESAENKEGGQTT